MDGMKIVKVALILCTLQGFIVLTVPAYTNTYYNKIGDVIEFDIGSHGFIILEGIVESPSIVYPISFEDFIKFAYELDNPRIVRDGNDFYIFTEDLLIAYKYSFDIKPKNPLSWVFPIGEWVIK